MPGQELASLPLVCPMAEMVPLIQNAEEGADHVSHAAAGSERKGHGQSRRKREAFSF